MADRIFQIGEFGSDPFDGDPGAAGEGEEPADHSPGAARGRHVGEAEAMVFEDGVPVTRRATLPEVELLEEISAFRGRTKSEPTNFVIAVQYGRELRRMSDEFVLTLTDRKGLHVSKSADTMVSRIYRKVSNYLPGRGGAGSRQADDR
uniref:bcl2-associated agonist of cell death n=1 Tax=Pristiophorus japonicus TaxID=55135 RepID=UPI00398F1F47